jgi:hypothetical protein
LKSLRRLGRRDRERISDAIGTLPEGDVKLLRVPNASGGCVWVSGG